MSSKKTNQNGLKIIIVGCGKVGSTLVEQLAGEGNDITIIDTNASKVTEIANLYDVMGLAGNGASFSTLEEAGIADTDLLIAVTESDELNLLCCTIAKQENNCAAIARVRKPEYSKELPYIREKLDLAMIINPQYESAKEASRILYMPTALDVNSFAHGMAEMIKFKIPDDHLLDNKRVMELSSYDIRNILICAVERDGEVFIPSGQFMLRSGDVISFVATRKNARIFLEKVGFNTTRVKNCMIVGGGMSSFYLAKELINMGIEVKIIELDKARCEELSTLLPTAIIINGDATNQELLKEEGIEFVESFVPLTGIDEENVMLTLFAKQVSGAKVITKIDHINYKGVISKLDLGSTIYPRYITTEAIIKYVRGRKNSMDAGNIETLYHLFDNRVEAIEFRVRELSAATDVPLKDLKIKKDLVVAFINRRGKILVPSGLDSIQLGDTVMIVTKHTGFHDLTDILE